MEACCACGGSSLPVTQRPTAQPTRQPTSVTLKPTPVPSVPGDGCIDILIDGKRWYDEAGPAFECVWYASEASRCGDWGNNFRNFGLVANEACCVCGGGHGIFSPSLPRPTPLPTSFYTARPTVRPTQHPSGPPTPPPTFVAPESIYDNCKDIQIEGQPWHDNGGALFGWTYISLPHLCGIMQSRT